jgi:putative addiction module component (TIGR02574 family)
MLEIMGNTLLAEILKLPAQERIQLVELVWESIATVPEALSIPPSLQVELEQGLAEARANPEGGFSWEQVKQAARDGSWRTA